MIGTLLFCRMAKPPQGRRKLICRRSKHGSNVTLSPRQLHAPATKD